jgi:cell division protein FtsA
MSFFDHRMLLSAKLEEEPPSGRLIGALDFGASKTACMIGRADAGALFLLGLGHARPQMGDNGAPRDFDACVRAIRIAVDHAERMAGETITSVAVGFAGKGLSSRRVEASMALPAGPVAAKSVRAVMKAALALAPAGRTLLHAIPLGYRVDGGAILADPRGQTGKSLSVALTLVTAPAASIAALTDCINEAGLQVARIIASPYAAGLAVLSPEECAMGAVALDFGASHVGVAAFQNGCLVLAENAPVGGADLTTDIAERLSASHAAAERIKVLHGGFSVTPPQETPVEAPRIGPDGRLEAAMVSRGVIFEAMGPRLEEMLAAVKGRLAPLVAHEGADPWRAAITGAGAYLSGLRDIAAHVLTRQVRAGRPVGFGALDEGAQANIYAVAAGLLRFMADPPPEALTGVEALVETQGPARASPRMASHVRFSGHVGKAWAWLKENF